jgi:hypothetical protein
VHRTLATSPRRARSAFRPTALGFLTLGAALLINSCAEQPTSVAGCVPSSAFGPRLNVGAVSAGSVVPSLVDARDRLVPALAAAHPDLSSNVASITAMTVAADRDAACRAFNALGERWPSLVVAVPTEQTPDLEALRLALRLTHAYLATP